MLWSPQQVTPATPERAAGWASWGGGGRGFARQTLSERDSASAQPEIQKRARDLGPRFLKTLEQGRPLSLFRPGFSELYLVRTGRAAGVSALGGTLFHPPPEPAVASQGPGRLWAQGAVGRHTWARTASAEGPYGAHCMVRPGSVATPPAQAWLFFLFAQRALPCFSPSRCLGPGPSWPFRGLGQALEKVTQNRAGGTRTLRGDSAWEGSVFGSAR